MGNGANLKEFLKENKLTIKELSEKTGISLNTLYSITKRDSAISNSVMQKIAAALNISAKELSEFLSKEKVISDQIESRTLDTQQLNATSFAIPEIITKLNHLTESYEKKNHQKYCLMEMLQAKMQTREILAREIEELHTQIDVLQNDLKNRELELELLRKKISAITSGEHISIAEIPEYRKTDTPDTEE